MTNEKKTEPTKAQPKTKSADTSIEKKGDTELTEEELARAAGGLSFDKTGKTYD
jgi:hypothetical protein